ncbi:MAG: hypothetical protein HYY18_04445 [Planctomycetes bacterium]|nr:hypothetical protein [Planctomycetota bacterium]
MVSIRRCSWILAAVVLAASGAGALTLVRMSDADLVAHSGRIVVGTVESVSVAWEDPDGDGVRSIYTTARLRVEQVVKGADAAGDVLEIRTFGGALDGVTHVAPGLPAFAQGERALVCLAPGMETRKYSPVVGAGQGKWTIRADEAGVERARREFGGAVFVQPGAGGRLEPAAAPEAAEEPLADVLARLRAEVDR